MPRLLLASEPKSGGEVMKTSTKRQLVLISAVLIGLTIFVSVARCTRKPDSPLIVKVELGKTRYAIPKGYFYRSPPYKAGTTTYATATALSLAGTMPGFEPYEAAIPSANPFSGRLWVLLTIPNTTPRKAIRGQSSSLMGGVTRREWDDQSQSYQLYMGDRLQWRLYDDRDSFTLCTVRYGAMKYEHCSLYFPQDDGVANVAFEAAIVSQRQKIRAEVTSKINAWRRG
jgi:hypothetical protein